MNQKFDQKKSECFERKRSLSQSLLAFTNEKEFVRL